MRAMRRGMGAALACAALAATLAAEQGIRTVPDETGRLRSR